MIIQPLKEILPKTVLLNITLCLFENIIYTYITQRNGYVYVLNYADKYERIPEEQFYNSSNQVIII